MMRPEEVEVVSALIGGVIARRYSQWLATLDVPAETRDWLSLSAGAVSIPVLQTFMTEDDPIAAFNEQDALERALEGS